MADWVKDFINYGVLGLYAAMMIGVAVFTRKKTKNVNDTLLAGKGMGAWMTAFAYGTTYFSAVIFIGYAGKFGVSFGLAAIWVGIGNAVIGSLFAWMVLAKRTKIMTTQLNVTTMPEFFEKRYKSKGIKLFSALIIFIFLIPYSVSVYQGLGKVFEIAFGINFNWCILIMAVLTAIYLFFGGYYATALTDFIQGIIMIVGVVVMIACVVAQIKDPLAISVNSFIDSIFPKFGNSGILNDPVFNLVIIVLLTSFGVWALPQTVHKYYAVKDNSAIKKGVLISTIFALIVGVGAYFAGSLLKFFPQFAGIANPDERVPAMLQSLLPAGLMGLIVVLLLSASMSTLSSLALSGSSAVSIDIYKGYIKKNASDKRVNIILKVACLVFVLISALLAVRQFAAIVTLMGLSWGVLAGCFMGPFVFGLFNKKTPAIAVWVSIIGCIAITVALVLVFGATNPTYNLDGSPKGIIGSGVDRSPLIGVITMAASVILTFICTLCFKSKNKEFNDELFKNVKAQKLS